MAKMGSGIDRMAMILCNETALRDVLLFPTMKPLDYQGQWQADKPGGKGKLSTYIFGTINVILYAIISYHARYYGEVMLNLLYYLPMQFYGFAVWNKHMNAETHEVRKKHMTPRWRWILLLVTTLGTAVYGFVLRALGGSLPFVDALSTVASVVAMMVSVKMFTEQWVIWIIVDIITVVMWAVAFANGSESVATLLMWIVYLGNAVIMYFKWMKEAKNDGI